MPRNYVKFFQHALKAGYFWAPNGWGLCLIQSLGWAPLCLLLSPSHFYAPCQLLPSPFTQIYGGYQNACFVCG